MRYHLDCLCRRDLNTKLAAHELTKDDQSSLDVLFLAGKGRSKDVVPVVNAGQEVCSLGHARR